MPTDTVVYSFKIFNVWKFDIGLTEIRDRFEILGQRFRVGYSIVVVDPKLKRPLVAVLAGYHCLHESCLD